MSKIICWWSGGVTSAVACKKAIDLYGRDNCEVVFIDTKNEDEDTYRFMKDCEAWYSAPIKTISAIPDKYSSIQDVWMRYKSLNVANGAVCSSDLKRKVRMGYQKTVNFKHQVFGFDINEPKRARSLVLNYPKTRAIFPLLTEALSKKDCIQILNSAGIEIPRMYKLGFKNNNCFNTGCVQGGIGYWQKIAKEFPEKFGKMAEMEHKLTDMKGKPVTMLTDRAGGARRPLFLKKHPQYPDLPDLGSKPIRAVKPLTECNGFCGVNDLSNRSSTELEINYE